MRTCAIVVSLLAVGFCSACGSSSGTPSSDDTRNLTGAVTASTLTTSLAAKSLTKATLACTDLEVCCTGYDGGNPTVVAVDSNCQFTIPLPLETFCYCAVFSGTDGDSDGCGDTYVGSLGCAARGYGGAIPIFAAADDSTTDISAGTVALEGRIFTATTDPCSVVDSDNDGTNDSSDADDDGDGVADDDDAAWSGGCLSADQNDSDDDDIPDIYESAWDSLADSDGDNVADFCDVSTDCSAAKGDTDGDCIPDSVEACEDDDDGDDVADCVDCDPDDASVTTGCYSALICAFDFDEDGIDICDDCDDFDDGNDLTLASGCSESCASNSTPCDANFECQLFAEDQLAAGTPVCSGTSVSCKSCIDGCCIAQ